MMPEYRPKWVIEVIRSRAAVRYPGCNYPAGGVQLKPWHISKPPLIIWNHRWEFDKNPEAFFAALDAIGSRGLDFSLALLGENFQAVPKPFLKAREKLGERIVQYGHVPSKEKYLDWLRQGTAVVSTARQENFGISVVEAIRHGCYPLLPDNLSYPEILPPAHHGDCLYNSQEDLVQKLSLVLRNPANFASRRAELAADMERYAWESVIDSYDRELERLASEVQAQ
jgi:glycosyltransferase involved in cell wall biosynthesis